MKKPTAENGGGGGAVAAAATVGINGKISHLNPNWAQLQKLLLGGNPKPSHHSSPLSSSVLGKRKERNGDVKSDEPSCPSVSSSSSSSILEPTSSDCSLTDTLAMDCEMVGVGTDGTRSALGRVTLVNAFGNVIYDEFVRPIERIVDFRTPISGIRPRNMRKAKDFCTVQKRVAGLINGKVLVGHALRNDLKVLFLTHPKKDIRDTIEYEPFRRAGRRVALRDLASQILGVKIQQKEHCSVEDARAAMLIYQKYRKEWEKSIKAKLKSKKNNDRNRRKKRRHEDSVQLPL